jgi:hypothetical protein
VTAGERAVAASELVSGVVRLVRQREDRDGCEGDLRLVTTSGNVTMVEGRLVRQFCEGRLRLVKTSGIVKMVGGCIVRLVRQICRRLG